MGYNQFNRLRSKSTGHSCQAPLNNYLFNQTEQFDYPTGMIDPCLISIWFHVWGLGILPKPAPICLEKLKEFDKELSANYWSYFYFKGEPSGLKV